MNEFENFKLSDSCQVKTDNNTIKYQSIYSLKLSLKRQSDESYREPTTEEKTYIDQHVQNRLGNNKSEYTTEELIMRNRNTCDTDSFLISDCLQDNKGNVIGDTNIFGSVIVEQIFN